MARPLRDGHDDDDDLLAAAYALGDLLLEDADVDDALEAALAVVREVVGGAPLTSLTVRAGNGTPPVTRMATDPVARQLDEWQYEHGEGPCVTAHEELVTCVARDLGREPPFGGFARVALGVGVRGVASFPLLVRSGAAIGSLNLFYREAGVIDEQVEATGARLAITIAPTLANFLTHQGAVALSGQLEEALAGRSVIERAKGLLMARLGIDGDAAFQLLSTQSQHENHKVREVAAELLAAHETTLVGSADDVGQR